MVLSVAKNLIFPNPNHFLPILNSKIHILVKVKEADVENHAVLSYALEEEESTPLDPAVKPDDKVSNISVYILNFRTLLVSYSL